MSIEDFSTSLEDDVERTGHSVSGRRTSAEALDGTGTETPEALFGQEKRAVGAFSDFEDDGSLRYSDTQTLLKKIQTPHDPDEEVLVSQELHGINADIGELDKRIARKKEEEAALGNARAKLGAPHEAGEELKELEAAREKLIEDKRNLEFADKHEPVFDELSNLSESEREHVAQTGRTKDGRFFHDKDGKRVREDVAKELAESYIAGGGRLTWGSLRKLGKVVERILKDITGVVKGIFRGGEGEQTFAE
ncbi:MAG: hypothetical protein UY50_C0008G0036 [Parcubacteria group bacterium GW2011_GWA2_49_9]|nr:MAG: hypothetical protein UY50_C0008G0036 [Parcubacteria group bacterium GW2011_GWA2_49_9]